MKVQDCPHCGGTALYTTVAATPANGVMGPHLLPKVERGQLNVVVCEDCGLTRFFARRVDIQALKASGAWTRVGDAMPVLGLGEP
jgi:predicted nucleic-acid-binding Zn-ribbon protein